MILKKQAASGVVKSCTRVPVLRTQVASIGNYFLHAVLPAEDLRVDTQMDICLD